MESGARPRLAMKPIGFTQSSTCARGAGRNAFRGRNTALVKSFATLVEQNVRTGQSWSGGCSPRDGVVMDDMGWFYTALPCHDSGHVEI